MSAAFPSAPYLLELIETAASENSTSYFPLLDRIASGYFAAAATDKELYSKFLDVLVEDGHVSGPEALSTFKLALSMRSAAPRIEAHYQYYSTGVEPMLRDTPQEGCAGWVLLGSAQYCEAALENPREVPRGLESSKALPFDRVLGAGPSAVLYSDITSPSFGPFHSSLVEKARRGEISYRVRYRRDAASEARDSLLPVNGYGVELALKKTDYIVIDDREAAEGEGVRSIPDTQVVLDEEEDVADLKPLSKAEVASLGLNAASLIMKSDEPLETLIKFTQDFPKYSAWMAAHNASSDFIEEQRTNLGGMVPTGMNVLWMNGVQLIERQIEPFTLVDMLRRERRLMSEVKYVGLTGKEAISLLSHPTVTSAKIDDNTQRFDWRDDGEGGNAIIWLNDLENDPEYEDFPKGVKSLLQRTYPGQVPSVRRNIFNVVAPVDVTKSEDLAVALQLSTFVQRRLPVRFGIVPIASGDGSAGLIQVLYHLKDTYDLGALSTYLELASHGEITTADKAIFEEAIAAGSREKGVEATTFEDVLASEALSERIRNAERWSARLSANSGVPTIFMNGMVIPRVDNWLQAMGGMINTDLRQLQQAIYTGQITDDTWIPGVFLDNAVPNRNLYIYTADEKDLKILDVGKLSREHASLLARVPVLEAYADSTKETWATLTVVADLATEDGLSLLYSAIQFRKSNPGVRLEVVHNPESGTGAGPASDALAAATEKLLEIDTIEDLRALVTASDPSINEEYDAILAAYLASTTFAPGSRGLLLNGRVIGPIWPGDAFGEDELKQLLEFEQASRILPVCSAVDDLGIGHVVSGPLAAARLTSIIALSTISDLPEGIFESAPSLRTSMFESWGTKHTAFEVGDSESASVHIVALIDPASEQGQRWAPILKVISQLDGVYVKLFLNPSERIQELPIKRFYRYVFASEPSFDDAGRVQALSATFKGLPSEALLTLGMDVPPAWLVTAKDSAQDPDNIKLSLVKGNVEAEYQLRNILIEGHSRLVGKGESPKGAQLVLGTEKDPHVSDTLIMANLGYFQFKANPGFYNIRLQDGRSSQIFEIESVGGHGYQAVPGDEGTEVALMDFQGTTLYPRLKRQPGMETADVLSVSDGNGESEGLLSKGFKAAAGFWGGGDATGASKGVVTTSAEEHAEINIFSVASGHLYERMLNIMILSVMKHTKHTVKFWFIEQFLSPSFKDSIPHLAEEYNFKYEMVTFKWPHWLRQQKEKQREIWGYKILFLDVLFPLSLDKVIFVDADQIVRADMMELVNFDLEGAPYGFTPMCDSRTEMEGFRFWKQGYWANYLRGKPYHISALYVVDLRRFRELAAGDRLRQQYHALSADPNSLSNLDQDLPNHMQFQIPIRSLPQEWLWCETWCSDESLGAAKTIDLCNNPMTKEPKLDRARRQVPEWTVYDDEIAAFERRRRGGGADADGGRDAPPSVQEQEQVKEREEALGSQGAEAGGEGEEEATVKNPKSRSWEEPTGHVKDEL
ncbi:related to KRE5 - killer toxin-resistance protein [Cephalotrichum gorgonifer]|uniref:Related to KRE5 - killer toxin-resistance protein n=1 Tax=Cephalotrichum gorgonifer TaxID=2041049 RepID=A0AAE8N417_9PEZI|nr:related to KRE5 - killer toxin-resistance protein [Cephalotrichum gorgonifer]